jgi:glycosyltransferase involved in cell wall biosynthesis
VRLIEAYASSTLPKNGIRLVLSGKNNAELSELSSKLGVGDFVVFAGRIPAEDIPAYYRGALAVAYVSLFEGFGLPIVEAFNCGVPVITSNVSAMPEVAAGGGLIVDPRSVEEIRSALDRVTGDPNLRERLIEAGRQRRADFDWNKSAAKTWEIVGNVAD